MKYGMRERVSGALILVALAVIFLPMLFDEPAPRSERPEPVLSIEQPVEVERQDVPDPEPPASLGEIREPLEASSDGEEGESSGDTIEEQAASATESLTEQAPDGVDASAADASAPDDSAPDAALQQEETVAVEPATEVVEDPIAELARAADERLAARQAAQDDADEEAPSPTGGEASGDWAVQVGSFGQPDNAERLVEQLEEQGFSAYSRPRDNDLTTVYVGPFDASEDGEASVAELKERANLQGLLVRVRD